MGRGMKIAMALVVAVPVTLIAIAALNAPGAIVKDYRFPLVEIDARVRPDGALVLNERRTFAFQGDFTFAYFTIEWPIELIQDFSISEGGKVLPAAPYETGGAVRADWT